MAKMIPANIERNDSKRTGEYLVYDWLSNEEIPGVAFYSHKQNNHEIKTMSEVDFLYICQAGILCIEVKGGYIHKAGPVWKSTNKRNQTFEIQDPFWQSHGCMKAISSTIETTYGRKSIESKFCIGCAVVFPECIAECSGDSVIQEVMFDGRKNLSDFPQFLLSCLKYWSDELYRKQQKRTVQINESQVKQLKTLFEASFCAVPSMKLQIESSYEEMLRLTEEQYDILNSIDDNKRSIIYGVAGTGKSILAVEKLRLNLCKKRKVAYLCFNKNMAAYVSHNVSILPGSFIGTYHSLLGKYTDKAYELTVDELNASINETVLDLDSQYDVVIIDEAQDLLTVETIKIIDKLLIGGMKSGEWIIFADPNQNIFMEDHSFEEAENYLKENFNPCVFRLYKNCRNTAPIARRNAMLTSTPTTKYLTLTGPEVKTIEYESSIEFIHLLDKELRSILSGGTFVKDIVILSPKKKENSLLSQIESLAGVDLVEVRNFKGMKRNQINYMTVQSFKGLESKIVFYIDIDGFESKYHRRMNYVAMSRAQIYLCYFVNSNLKNEYEQRLIDGIAVFS